MPITDLDGMWNGETAERKTGLERGIYRGEIIDYTVKQVGQNSTWALILKIAVRLPAENEGIEKDKCYYLTPKSMPYVARDLKDIGAELDPSQKLSEQMQNLNVVGTEVDFKFDIPKDKEHAEVVWLHLAQNSAKVPQGAGDGVSQVNPIKVLPRPGYVGQTQGKYATPVSPAANADEDDTPF